MQDYKSLRVAVMNCATLVDTHRDSCSPAKLLAQRAVLKLLLVYASSSAPKCIVAPTF